MSGQAKDFKGILPLLESDKMDMPDHHLDFLEFLKKNGYKGRTLFVKFGKVSAKVFTKENQIPIQAYECFLLTKFGLTDYPDSLEKAKELLIDLEAKQ